MAKPKKPIKILDTYQKPTGATIYVVNSSSDARRHYNVQKKGRSWACACKGWTWRVPRQNCVHIKNVIQQLAA